jgi:TM2 domain-containing membrane protein YozV
MNTRYDDNRARGSSSNLVVAYLIWFFLGYGGVHRMYLGRWTSGLLMLGVFVMSWVLSLVFIGYVGLGFILVWWVIDALLIPGMVRRSY